MKRIPKKRVVRDDDEEAPTAAPRKKQLYVIRQIVYQQFTDISSYSKSKETISDSDEEMSWNIPLALYSI